MKNISTNQWIIPIVIFRVRADASTEENTKKVKKRPHPNNVATSSAPSPIRSSAQADRV